MVTSRKHSLLDNSRFYVLMSTFLLTITVAAFLRIQIPSDQLFYIRTQQVYGLLAMVYWFVALAVSPLGYVIGKGRLKHVAFARRAIGVSAVYFAVLHAVVALWGQLGGISEIALLPELFKWSIAGGAAGLFILLIMAATSFDKVVAVMTYKKWKWLHRLVYLGFILVTLHIWTVGTHLAYAGVQWAAFSALAALSGLELFRMTKLINDKYLKFDKIEAATLFIASWVAVIVIIALTPLFIKNYHSNHTDHANGGSSGVHNEK